MYLYTPLVRPSNPTITGPNEVIGDASTSYMYTCTSNRGPVNQTMTFSFNGNNRTTATFQYLNQSDGTYYANSSVLIQMDGSHTGIQNLSCSIEHTYTLGGGFKLWSNILTINVIGKMREGRWLVENLFGSFSLVGAVFCVLNFISHWLCFKYYMSSPWINKLTSDVIGKMCADRWLVENLFEPFSLVGAVFVC